MNLLNQKNNVKNFKNKAFQKLPDSPDGQK